MRAALQLVVLYFTAAPLMVGLTALGLVFIGAGLAGYLYYPTWTFGTGMRSSPLWYQSLVLLAPWLGLILLFFATTLLPSIVERFAFGRSILVLPYGRARVLASVFAAAGAIALLAAAAATLSFFYFPNELKPENVFSRTLLVVLSNVSLMYLAIWIVGKARGIWLLLGSLFIVLGVVLPLGLIGRPSGVPTLVWAGAAAWAAFAVLLLGGLRLGHALTGTWARLKRRATTLVPSAAYSSGSELDLLLGTSRPAVVAVGQAVPIAAATWFIAEPSAWLLYLTAFSAISGAITSTAAARSRVLWLRHGWSRPEIFRRVEAAYWRYNAYPLGVLLLLFAGIGQYLEFGTPVLALGLPLLALGGIVSSYLGLMMTRGLRWLEVVLGIATMGLIMAAAGAVGAASSGLSVAIELEIALAAAALVYRLVAKARWERLDWMVCRQPATARGAG